MASPMIFDQVKVELFPEYSRVYVKHAQHWVPVEDFTGTEHLKHAEEFAHHLNGDAAERNNYLEMALD